MKKTQIILAVMTALVVLYACLGLVGYLGVRKMRESRRRTEARAAVAAQDWKNAEKLLKAYVTDHIYSDEDFLLLAQVYRHFGNTEEEMRCLGRVSALNPRNREYWDLYVTRALEARAFPHLYTTLTYKLNLNEELAPRERLLYFICMIVMKREKEAEELYEVMLDEDPDAFQRDDLGRFAEFLLTYRELTRDDCIAFLKYGVESEDPFVRMESILYSLDYIEPDPAADENAAETENAEEIVAEIVDEPATEDAAEDAAEVAVEDRDEDELKVAVEDEAAPEDVETGAGEGREKSRKTYFEKKEAILKLVVEMNRFVGIPIMAEFYFDQLRFGSVIELAEPYLADIDDARLAIIYADSCVFDSHPEKLKPLTERFRSFGPKYRAQITYFEALYDYCQGPESYPSLAGHMQDLGGAIQTDLSHLISLQLALNNDNVERIRSSLETIVRSRPFYDLQDRARTLVRKYLENKIEEDPASADDSRMARLAQLVSTPEVKDPLLMRLVLSDLNRRNVVTKQVVGDYLKDFPFDPYLLQIAAEFELFNDNPELCLEYTERYYSLKDAKRSTTFDLLHMLAQELSGNIDEAAREYTALVDNSEMDRGILYRYFRFCIQHERVTELATMAERLAASSVPDLNALSRFFQAEVLFFREEPGEALSLLETAETESQDFALHAADRFREHGWTDQALTRYYALVGTYPDRGLILSDIAEVYLAKDMMPEAISYAERAWETDMDDAHAQFVYAKALAAGGRYQEAEKTLRIPYRQVELEPELRELWTDIMTHCVQEDFADRHFLRALDRANHYLILYPGDYLFQDYKDRAEEEFRQEQIWSFLEEQSLIAD